MHEHGGCCKHEQVKFCKKCGVPYCENCGKEWAEKCTQSHNFTYYPWFTETITTPTYDYKYEVTCNHG